MNVSDFRSAFISMVGEGQEWRNLLDFGQTTKGKENNKDYADYYFIARGISYV